MSLITNSDGIGRSCRSVCRQWKLRQFSTEHSFKVCSRTSSQHDSSVAVDTTLYTMLSIRKHSTLVAVGATLYQALISSS